MNGVRRQGFRLRDGAGGHAPLHYEKQRMNGVASMKEVLILFERLFRDRFRLEMDKNLIRHDSYHVEDDQRLASSRPQLVNGDS